MKRPNFFIVGAPKCGTTSMNYYLSQHPDIFMAQKEIHYFGSDLKVKVRVAEGEYLNYFQNAGERKMVGEASVWYLFSKTAAEEINKFSPNSKIIIMLRNPVDVLYSLHSQHLYNANEDVKDFKNALDLDSERSKGINLPNSLDFVELPLYKDSVLFAEQVKRYIDTFGKENVHIILYEDLKNNIKDTVNKTLKFLGVAPEFEIKYQVVNPNKKITFLTLHRLIKYPAARLKAIVRTVLPNKKIRHQLMFLILQLNIKIAKRKKMDEKLRNELRHFFSDDVKELSSIINRDLTEWIT